MEKNPSIWLSKVVALMVHLHGASSIVFWKMVAYILEGISGTSAGSMNAAVLAYGLLQGGPEGAREKLYQFWWDISQAGKIFNPCKQMPWEKFWYGDRNMDNCIMHWWFETVTRWFSPYQLNPYDFNPLKDVLLKNVDFEELQMLSSH